jgi:hypothetical protein
MKLCHGRSCPAVLSSPRGTRQRRCATAGLVRPCSHLRERPGNEGMPRPVSPGRAPMSARDRATKVCHGRSCPAVLQCPRGTAQRRCATAGLVRPCSHPRDRCAEHFPRPWGLTFRSAPSGQVHLSGTSVSALAFTPLLRGLCRQKGAVLPTGGHRRTARAVTKEAPRPPWGSLLQRYACIRAGEHSKPHPRPLPRAGPTSPSCPTALYYTTFSLKVKRKTALHIQIGDKPRRRQDL